LVTQAGIISDEDPDNLSAFSQEGFPDILYLAPYVPTIQFIGTIHGILAIDLLTDYL